MTSLCLVCGKLAQAILDAWTKEAIFPCIQPLFKTNSFTLSLISLLTIPTTSSLSLRTTPPVFPSSKEHPFPEAVAVQAGYESRYGASEIARNANNLFGIKARKNEEGNLIPNIYRAKTKEERIYLFENAEKIIFISQWIKNQE